MTPNRFALTLAVVLAAPVVAVSSLGENLILQSTFDEGIIGWDNLAGKLWEQVDDARPLSEQPNPGSLEMLATDGVSTCIGIIGDEDYEISAFVKLMPSGDAFGLAGISLQWHSNSFCTHYMEGPIIHPFSYHYSGIVGWSQAKAAGKAPLAAQSALISLGAQKMSASAESELRVRFDDVVVAPIYGNATTTIVTTTSTAIPTTTVEEETTTTTDEPNAPGCADPLPPYDTTTASDALYVLRSSVGVVLCGDCFCDTDGSGTQTAGDALRTLRLAVGHPVAKICGACEA